MHFTSQQTKAILFIATAFLLSAGYYGYGVLTTPPPKYDFSEFDTAFKTQHQKIQADTISPAELAFSAKQLPSLAEGGGEKKPKKESSLKKPVTNNSGKLDINTASLANFMRLPGIGEKLAERIIQYRSENGRFQKIADIKKVRGIGTKRFEKIEMLIAVKN